MALLRAVGCHERSAGSLRGDGCMHAAPRHAATAPHLVSASGRHTSPLLPPTPTQADAISEDDLRDQFYPYGELRSLKKVPARGCAFVTYASREAAERAADELANK